MTDVPPRRLNLDAAQPERLASLVLPRDALGEAVDDARIAQARGGDEAAIQALGRTLFGQWPLPPVREASPAEARAPGDDDDEETEGEYDAEVAAGQERAAADADDERAGVEPQHAESKPVPAGSVEPLSDDVRESPLALFVQQVLAGDFDDRVIDDALCRIASVFAPRVIGRYRPERGRFVEWLALNAEDLTLQQLVLEYQCGRAGSEVMAVVYRLYFQRPDEVTGRHTGQISLAEYWIRQVFRGSRGIEPKRSELAEVRDLFVSERLAVDRFWQRFDVSLGASFRRWLVQAVHNLTRDYLAKAPGPRFVSLDDALNRVLNAEDTEHPAELADAADASGGRGSAGTDTRAQIAGLQSADAHPLENAIASPGDLWQRILPVVFTDLAYQLCYKLMSDLDLTADDLDTLARERLVRWCAEVAVAHIGGYDVVALPEPGSDSPAGDDEDDESDDEGDTQRRGRLTVLEAPQQRLEDEPIRDIKRVFAERLASVIVQSGALPAPIPRTLTFEERGVLITHLRDEIDQPGAIDRRLKADERAQRRRKGGKAAVPQTGPVSARKHIAELWPALIELAAALRSFLGAEQQYEPLAGKLATALGDRHEELSRELRRRSALREQRTRGRLARIDTALRQRQHQLRQLRLARVGAGEVSDAERIATLEGEAAELSDRSRRLQQELGRTVGLRDAEIGYMLGRTHGAVAGLKNRIRRNLAEFRRGAKLRELATKVLAETAEDDLDTLAAFAHYQQRLVALGRFEAFPRNAAFLRRLLDACPEAGAHADEYAAAIGRGPAGAADVARLRARLAGRAWLVRIGLNGTALAEFEQWATRAYCALTLLGVTAEDLPLGETDRDDETD